MTSEGLSKKKRIRGGHKSSATRMLSQIDELLGQESPDLSKLTQLKLSLQEKLETLKLLDSEMVDLVEEKDLNAEIEQADAFKEGIYTAIIKIDKRVSQVSVPIPENPVDSSPRSNDRVKLPKLVLRPFNGEITAWTTFWESYESAVHNNRNLTDIDKFNYLNSLLSSTAREAVAGLSLTSANYRDAIAILKKRFGNEQQIKAKHMEILMTIEPVSSSRDLKALRKLHDLVESQVRSLSAIGVDPASYGSLLIPVLLNKLPPDLQLMASRRVPEGDWKLDPLLKIIEEEIAARERVQSKPSQPQQRRNPEQIPPTATALMSNAAPSTFLCCFCQQPHTPAKCTTVVQVDARKQILKRTGRCFRCLRKGHVGRECRSSIKCYNCSGRHHSSICPRESSQQPANGPNGTTTTSATPTAPNTGQPSTGSGQVNRTSLAAAFANPIPTTTALHVCISKSVFLQTAQTEVCNPLNPQLVTRVRLVLDSGSQRSYVTCRVKDILDLKPESTQQLSIATFGAQRKENRVCDAVNVVMKMRDGSNQEIVAFVVPHICEPIAPQPLNICVKDYEHLSRLELADSYDNMALEVDMLIGSDYYWGLATGEIERGDAGPVAINTKLGWVLSGPGPPISTDLSATSLITIHTLMIDAEPLSDNDLGKKLRAFWELESLGIEKVEKSTHDKFEDDICFKEGRYEVSLPWREMHEPLSDNYALSLRRLRGLLNRLRQTPEILREYNATIQDQLKKGIVDVVPDSDAKVGEVHYLPHHAVIRRDKETTKLRVVYDASARSGGPSLNDCLYTGPKFNQNVFDILLRFRSYRVALTADIEKAFLMISISQRDRNALRFLWVDDIQQKEPKIVTLRFTRVVFGVSSSPFLLNATIRHHLEKFSSSYPKLVSSMLQSLYVDDLVCGANDEESAYKLFVTSKKILNSGSFNLRKFTTNSPNLQRAIDDAENSQITSLEKHPCNEIDETYAKTMIRHDCSPNSGAQKTLGVNWDVHSDQFFFSFEGLAAIAAKIEPTKRNVVSVVSQFHDPLGLVTPVTIRFKIFMQTLYNTTAAWDQPLTGKFLHKWQCLVAEIRDSESIRIPRYYCHNVDGELLSYELCGFCDASMGAYAAVVYMVVRTTTGDLVRFLASKTRVAPTQTQTNTETGIAVRTLIGQINHKHLH